MSEFKPYSIATVVEDKPEGSFFVLATPREKLYDQPSGNIREGKETQIGSIPSSNQSNLETEHEATNIVRARWRSRGNGNRATPPDVYRNETIELFRYGDTDEICWDTATMEARLRGREKVVHSYSNREGGDPDGEDPSFENSYTTMVDTRNKKVALKTVKNDGEAAAYDVEFDTKNGKWKIADSDGNIVHVASNDGVLTISINELIEFNTKDYTINCKNKVTNNEVTVYNSSEKMDFNTPIGTFSENVEIQGDLLVKGDAHFEGDVVIDGSLTVGGAISAGVGGGGGGGTFNGPIHSTQNIQADGTLTSGGNTVVGGDLSVSGSYPCRA